MSTIKVGDRVRIAPHHDLWMAGCRYATVTSVVLDRVEVDLDTGRRVTLREDSLDGVVEHPEVSVTETEDSWLSFKRWIGVADRTDANAGLPQMDHLLRTGAALLSEHGENPEYDRAIVELLMDLGVFGSTESADKDKLLTILRRHGPDRRPTFIVDVRFEVKADDWTAAHNEVVGVINVGIDDEGDYYGHTGTVVNHEVISDE